MPDDHHGFAPDFSAALREALGRPILSPSEQEFRQRVRDLEAAAYEQQQTVSAIAARTVQTLHLLEAENARLRRAVRVLAKLQRDARVREAMMEVMSDA